LDNGLGLIGEVTAVAGGRVVSICWTGTAGDIKSVEALNDVKTKGRETGKGSGAGSEADLDGGEGSGYIARIVLDQQRIATEGE